MEPIVFVVMQTGKRANGGVESITQIIERLIGYRRIVVTQLETPTTQRWRDSGAEVLVWPLPYPMHGSAGSIGKRLTRGLEISRFNTRMYRLLRATKARLVHCNDVFGWMHSGVGARLASASVVYNVRDTKPGGRYRSHWKLAHRMSQATIVLSREMAEDLAHGLGSSPERMTTIYSVVDTEKKVNRLPSRAELRKSLGIDPSSIAVGCVGVLSPKKNQLNLIRNTLANLPQSDLPIQVFFIGDCEPETDPYAKECVEEVRRLGLADRVTFKGFSSEIFQWYRALDITILASEYEGLARAMIESLACGTPVISFPVCSAREILEGRDCGIVVPAGAYSTFWEKILTLAHDGEQRSRYGAAGERLARDLFEPGTVVRQYEATYRALLV